MKQKKRVRRQRGRENDRLQRWRWTSKQRNIMSNSKDKCFLHSFVCLLADLTQTLEAMGGSQLIRCVM